MKNIIIILSLLILSISCTKEFLDKPKLATKSSENFFYTQANVEMSIMAIYNVIRGYEAYGRDYWVLGSVASDDAEAGGENTRTDQMDIQVLDRLTHNSSNSICKEFWFAMYQGIYRSNVVIEFVNNPYLETTYKKRARAEALAMRALFHFELVKVFGGVPIMNEIKAPKDLAMPRNTIKEVFTQIEQDLKEAAAVLPDRWDSTNEGRISAGTCKALLVKLYVFESSYAERGGNTFAGCTNRWEDARALSEQIILDAGKYGFGLEDNFANIWTKAGDYSKENIFKANALRIAAHEDPGISYGEEYWPNGSGTGCEVSVWQGCRSYYQIGKKKDTTIVADYVQLGYGFNQPTKELFNAYENGDPRRDIGFIEDKKDSVKYWQTNKWVLLCTKTTTFTGYGCRKYLESADVVNIDSKASEHAGGLSYKIYRYADFLLLAAEANYKTGQVARATELVNMVRARARNSGKTGLPADLPTVTYDDILKERQMELACEGHRFFDLVRTGKAYQAINGQMNATTRRALSFQVGKNEFFPIPDGEIVMSGYVIKQNPGY